MNKLSLKNILFLDIETVSGVSKYDNLEKGLKDLWDKKCSGPRFDLENHTVEELYEKKAAIFAEFGKIVVIGMGFIYSSENNPPELRLSALYDNDETRLLKNFKDLLENKFSPSTALCAHNGKEFDFPYICRRMTVLGIKLPKILQLSNKKPWEVPHLDTMEMWKFGDRKAYTSLDLLTNILNIPSSKDLMDGGMVHEYYYMKKDLESVKDYCLRDVIALAQVFLKMNFLDTIPEQNITYTHILDRNITDRLNYIK